METDKKSNGALMGSIIIILILVLGGIYIWMSKTNMPAVENEEIDTTQTEQELDNIENELNTEGEIDFTAGLEAVE